MASSMSHLVSTTPSISTEEQANLARQLIQANELYSISNSIRYSNLERKEALKESFSLTKEVLGLLPNNQAALNLMARIEMDNGNLSSAEGLLSKAHHILEHDENTLLNLGYLYIAKRSYVAAENWFKKALDENRYSAQAFSGVALAKLRQKDYLSAFNHYKRLIELGYDSELIHGHFLDAIEFLHCDAYQPDLEGLCIEALNWENQDTSKLANFVSSLLVQKYDLDNDDAILDLNILIQDRLLIDALNKVLLPNLAVENLVTEVRKAILAEVAMTRNLRDDYLPIAIAIGVYVSRTDYALITTQEEDNDVAYLVEAVKQVVAQQWDMEDVVGALINISMYQPIYSNSFSTQLLRYDANEWPLAIQNLLQANLYDLCDEHQISFDLIDANVESLLSDEIKRCCDRWSFLKTLARTNIYNALGNELGFDYIPKRFKHEPINVLLVGCGSGLRAFYLSQAFENVNVVAVDNSQANITYTRMMAKRLGIRDIQFVHTSYDDTIIGDETFDIIEFGEAINHVEDPARTIHEWKSLLSDDGLMRLSLNTQKLKAKLNTVIQLVQDRRLSPTADNIRHLRYAINQEGNSGLWDALLSEPQFYSGAGCKALFFNTHNHYFQLPDLESVLSENQLQFIGFVDLPTDSRETVQAFQPATLHGWKILDQDNKLFSDTIEVYCSAI